MENSNVTSLASMLRSGGNIMISKNVKLVLTEDILNEVNDSFDLINERKEEAMTSSFHIMQNTIESADLFSDIQFLHAFFRKIPCLKLTGRYNIDNTININCFPSLKYIEINNINLKRLNGLQNFKDVLEVLVCSRNIQEIKDVLTCQDDVCENNIWYKLRAVYLAHNFIINIDTSFQYAPYIHTLDLSFNCLENVDNLNYLPNLKNLNIAYNKLKNAPNFHGLVCNKLQVLNLKYNFIENIMGLSLLFSLRDLDLSFNFLSKHETLVPFANILSLQSLKLTGNPISYHPRHRIQTCQYLNSNTATVAFYLDNKLINNKEKSVVGSIHSKSAQTRPHLASQSSQAGSITVEKPKRVREATISNQNETGNEIDESVTSVSSLITSQEHLETKRNLEKLREKLGEKWLLGESTTGQASPKKSPQFSSTPYDVDFLIHSKEHFVSAETFQDSQETTSSTVVNTNSTETYEQANSNTPTETDPYLDGNVSDSSSDSLINIGRCDDDLYLVTRVGETEQIVLVATEKFLSERDVIVNAKEHYRWDTETLISCKLENDVIYLEFDRLRTDCKQRQYIVDDIEERQRLVNVLTKFIEKRPAQEKETVKSYRCLKCNEIFKLGKNDCNECPSCASKMIIEEQKNVDAPKE